MRVCWRKLDTSLGSFNFSHRRNEWRRAAGADVREQLFDR